MVKAHSSHKNRRSRTMKRLLRIAIGILFLGAVAFALNGYAFAWPAHGPGSDVVHLAHGYGWHHGPGHLGPGFHKFYRYHGPAVLWRAGRVWVDGDCYWVKRCRTNRFGITRCRRVRICD